MPQSNEFNNEEFTMDIDVMDPNDPNQITWSDEDDARDVAQAVALDVGGLEDLPFVEGIEEHQLPGAEEEGQLTTADGLHELESGVDYSDDELEGDYDSSDDELEAEIEDEIGYFDHELKNEQSTVPRTVWTVREHLEQVLQISSATEAQFEEGVRRIGVLEEENRLISEDGRLLMERISELEIDLESYRVDSRPNAASEVLQAQSSELQERVEVLERELKALQREKSATSHKVGTSSKSASASASLHKQYVEDLKRENLRLVARSEDREAKARREAAQMQRTIDDLQRDKAKSDSMLNFYMRPKQQDRARNVPVPLFETDIDSAQELADARTRIDRLQKTVEEQQSVIEQHEQKSKEHAYTEAGESDRSIVSGSLVPDHSAHPQGDLPDLGTLSTGGEGSENSGAESAAPDIDDLEVEQPKHESENETLRLRCQELEDRNRTLEDRDRGLQERNSKWLKLFKRFLQRAADVQRKDASKHQIKKGFKDLHKIVKESGLPGL